MIYCKCFILSYFIWKFKNQIINCDFLFHIFRTYKKLSLQPIVKREYIEEFLRYLGKKELYEEFKNWKTPHFQINGNILKEKGCPTGKAIGVVMTKLKTIWADNNFNTSVDELLDNHLPKVLEEIKSEISSSNKKLKLSK